MSRVSTAISLLVLALLGFGVAAFTFAVLKAFCMGSSVKRRSGSADKSNVTALNDTEEGL